MLHQVESDAIWHETDVLIIGGGTAGCMAAVVAKEQDPQIDVTVMEKAHIQRSGCLAAGMNAINAYLNPGESPESFVRFVRDDACGLIREDLVLSNAERLNEMVEKVASWGLPVIRDDQGRPKRRGRWNIEIFGESLKPIIAEAVEKAGVRVFNRIAATGILMRDGRALGVVGMGVRDGRMHVVIARAIIMAAGGASGLYRPNNPGPAHHKIWYCPFNAGAGYAMGIRAGAEMTSLEMRFIALRTKDVMAPTGTLALGFGASQVNASGEQFMKMRYQHVGGEGAPTPWRVYGPTRESIDGRGPCYLDTRGLSPERVRQLKQAYLSMYPGIVLYWAANNFDPGLEPVEICGTEPYVMGGHCQAGYWVNTDRETTIPGLYAAGDVSGGAPYKFVSGCWAEGALAAESAVRNMGSLCRKEDLADAARAEQQRLMAPTLVKSEDPCGFSPHEGEDRLQKIMDEYAGGLSTGYSSSAPRLDVARQKLEELEEQMQNVFARNPHELMAAHELIDRVWVARALVCHLRYREETRWPAFQTRSDFPGRDDANWLAFVNSRYDSISGRWEMLTRPYQRLVDQTTLSVCE